MKNVLDQIPRSVLWLAVAASLFCSVVNVSLTMRATSDAHANDTFLCHGVVAVLEQSNRANGSIASVLGQSLANIQSRANTKKELPSDKASAKVFIGLIGDLRTGKPLDCSKLH